MGIDFILNITEIGLLITIASASIGTYIKLNDRIDKLFYDLNERIDDLYNLIFKKQ